jgi:hypothetical protein
MTLPNGIAKVLEKSAVVFGLDKNKAARIGFDQDGHCGP